MGAGQQFDIHGAKGGSTTPKSPTEATDSLRSTNLAKILIAVGEGEFSGTPTAKNIYLDNTPIEDASGNINFPNVKWEWRSGSVEQSYIPGIPSVENETTVNVELRNDTPWIRSITNTQLSAVRVRLAWPALQAQDDEGNVGGYRIEYAIDIATDGGAYQQVLLEAADGKTTTRYERSRRIDLPASTSGWQIRVRRITPNQNTNKIADAMLVAGLTEVIDKKLRYPNTALLYIEFDAEQFTNIPAVTVETDAKKWQIPSNYDPVNRSYSGVWDGTFKEAWTNNAAWITYGVCTEDRFGLGKRIKPFMVDKWELYRIAQYCDVAVSNGVGGLEPRFLCDMNIQGKSDAWGLLRDISAIYRGMTYWAQGQLVMQADMPRAQDFDYVFTRANVIDGKFSYGSASAKTRYTRAIVSYDNPANNYDTDVIPYADLDLQRRFGDKPVEISAIGCTRASEAQRRGKWVVLTNNLDRTVGFKTGMEGAIPLPGYIIPIADSLLAGREIGGRISAVAGRVVTLDRDTEAKVGDRMIINLPSGKAEARTVQSVAGRAVTVTTAYSEAPIAELQWAIDADDLAIPLYRVMSVKRTTEGDYEISALQYEPSKFSAIDTGARLEERPISVIPVTVVPPPASVTLTANSAIDQGIAVTTMTIVWPAVAGAVGYDVEWRKDSGNWIKVQRTGNTSVDITGIYSGAYLARVRAVSAFDISSIWKSSILTQLNGKTGLPPAITSLVTESLIFGIGIKWTFPAGAEDTQRTELWYGTAPALENATKLADLAYPQTDYTMQGLRAGQQFFFWARLVDRTGNIGPWFPVAPTVVVGQASADADAILDMLVGEITASQLGQDLLSEIGNIGGSGPGSVNERLDQVRDQIEVIRGDLQGQIDDTDATLGQVKQDLLDQISDANEALTAVREELQGQIDAIADLADSMPYKPGQTYSAGQGVLGADGVIYQALQNVPVNTPPPNTTYWLNVGQAVITANGLASRVQILETSVTDVKGVQTAQASQITGLNSSLVTTNGNVTAAQNAANAASTVAGGKGKVLVQSATPAAADQLAQNLWIDTTGNANTPKRWTGSAWAAVTDKAATDAAAAAASALALAQTKADASAVNSLTTRVTNAEGTITSQGSAITSLTNTVSGKADASALNALTSRVTSAEGVNTSQGTAITNLTNTVGGKADASAVTALTTRVTATEGKNSDQDATITSQGQAITTLNNALPGKADASAVTALTSRVTAAEGVNTSQATQITNLTTTVNGKADSSTVSALSNTVTQQGTAITAQGSAITQINASIGALGASGVNLLPAEMTVFGAVAPETTANGGSTKVTVADVAAFKGYALQSSWTAASGQALLLAKDFTFPACNIAFKRQKYIVSFWARASVDGHQVGAYLRTFLADNATTQTGPAPVLTLTTAWARYSAVLDMTATSFTGSQMALVMQQNRSGVGGRTVWYDRIMLESVIGDVTEPSNFVIGNSFDQVASNAAATTALSARVTQTETGLTSQSTQLTNLSASIGNAGGENLVYNPSLDKLSSNNYPEGWGGNAAGGAVRTYSAVPSTLDPSGLALRYDLTGLTASGSNYAQLYIATSFLAPFSPLQSAAGSIYFRATAGLRIGFALEFWDAGSANLILRTAFIVTVATGAWQRATCVADSPAGTAGVQLLTRIQGTASIAAGFVEFDRAQLQIADTVSGWSDNNGVTNSAVTANATATTALTARVDQTEVGISSVSTQVTSLSNSIGGSGTNLILAEFSSFTKNVPTMAKAAQLTLTTEVDASAYTGYLLRASNTPASTGYLYLGSTTGDYNLRLEPNGKYIASFWAKGGAAHPVAVRLKYLNSAGTSAEIQVGLVNVTTTLTRYSVAFSAPAAVVGRSVLLLFTQNIAAIGDTWFDGFMLEEQVGTSTAPSAYTPGSASRQFAATSDAIDVLSSTVSNQAGLITSVSARATALENSVNSTTDGLATKASAAALSTLTNRVTSIEGVNTSQASSITDLNTSVSNISGQIGTAGIDPSPGCNWNFDYGTEGWSAQAATITSLGDGIRITATSAGPTILTSGLAIDGGLFRLVKAKITRRAGATTDWDGACYFGNADHGFSSSFYSRIANPNLAIGQSAIVTWDMTALTVGGGDWVSHLNTDLRLNFGAVNGSVFDVDWIVVGRMATAASSRALSQLSSTVTQQGATISAQASSITSLSSTVGNHTSQLQSQATTIADSAGKLSSSYTLKLALTSDGKRYAAGIGIGLDNSSGTVQSQFLVSADRFAVLNDLAGNVTSPFAVEGGQVFIRDAVIKKATITNALVGAAITSQTLTSYGTPVMTTDYSAGQITIQNQSTNGKYMVIRQDGIFSVSAGVVMFELQL